MHPPVVRADGYAAIADYGAIGDGRATALVARDGSIDWLCLPAHDSGSVFGGLLDAERAGSFELRPTAEAFGASQRYLEGSNVLQTSFETAGGKLEVTDAVTTDGGRLLPWWELVRRVRCVSGSVTVRWRAAPRFGYGTVETVIRDRDEHVTVAASPAGQLAILQWDAGEPLASDGAVTAEVRMEAGDHATLALVHSVDAPLPLPERDELEDRLDRTTRAWREWLSAHDYEGPWRDQVERSLLALRLLTSPSGAIAAAATTSLPERIGGDRNYDYRHAWPRDTSLALAALMHTGLREPAHQSLVWLLSALRSTHPRVQPVYRLGHGPLNHQFDLPLVGYRGSQPVREGNDAAGQLQLGAYGDLLHTAWLYAKQGNLIDPASGRRLAEIADLVCELWGNPDCGIWELADVRHYTSSKMGCWLTLKYALDLAQAGQIPGDRAAWERGRRAIAEFVETRCWSDSRGSYLQASEHEAVDAAVLLMLRKGYVEAAQPGRARATLDTIRRELADGAAVYRYSGMSEREGAFIACSFWVAESLACSGEREAARELIEETLEVANPLGLMSEEFDPATGELLSNFPQALSHLALINAAATIRDTE